MTISPLYLFEKSNSVFSLPFQFVLYLRFAAFLSLMIIWCSILSRLLDQEFPDASLSLHIASAQEIFAEFNSSS